MQKFAPNITTLMRRLVLLYLALYLGCNFGTVAYSFDKLGGTQAGNPVTILATLTIAGVNPKTWFVVVPLCILSVFYVYRRQYPVFGFIVLFAMSVLVSFITRTTLVNPLETASSEI